jgi:CDP-diacylglycerol--serine O-phosphatidyltransferase
MNIKKHIPNFITLLNLLCGCIALVFISELKYELAFMFVSIGIFFDFFDGFFARMFKVSGPLGLQLDSLADMVTSGVVPGFTMFCLLREVQNPESMYYLLPYFGFVITLGSCYRLANFNIDTRQTDSFIGLPTPANTLFIVSLPLVLHYSDSFIIFEILTNQGVLITVALLSTYILNAEIPLFSLKIKDFSLKNNAFQIIFVLFSVLLLIFLHYLAIPLVIVSYVILSIVMNKLVH